MKKLKGICVGIVGMILAFSSAAQEAKVPNVTLTKSDSLSVFLHRYGKFEGHLRSHFMNTINHGDYPDYYALGIGGGLGYYSPVIKKFQLGLSGFIIYNVFSTPLAPQSMFTNRYEIGLFDLKDPANHENLDRLEDLYLRYYFNKKGVSFLQVGKFHLKTPFINLQDGRMRPNLQEGAWMEWTDSKKVQARAGWLWRTSPRSTVHWYSMGHSIGIYPMGRAVDGTKSDYAGNVNSHGVGIANISISPVPQVTYQVWDYHLDGLFNLLFQKAEVKKKAGMNTWMGGVQYSYQQSLYHDTLSVSKQYIGANDKSHVLGARLGLSRGRGEWNLNYTRITRHGRFLFPREWGVEPFYTFLPRERNEGSGDVQAISAQYNGGFGKAGKVKLKTGAGAYWLPSVDNVRLNKYAMDSYYQVNVNVGYTFSGFFNGLQADLLYVYKGNLKKGVAESPMFLHNKIDMHTFSFVLDYYF